ncbi:MAG: hypothetical protein PQJ59_08030 [Spirochaetales bacterium]|nr:hypothetical protein [Spirochaetales bacterium]
MKPILLWPVLMILFSFSLGAQSSFDDYEELLDKAGYAENWEVRQKYTETIMAPFYTVMHVPAAVSSQIISEGDVKFELRRAETSFYLLFLNEDEGEFPTLGRGNWVIKRDIRSGDFLQAKIFLQNDADTFIRLFPGEDRSYLDVYLYGRQIYTKIPVSVAFEELILSPFARITSLTENIIDWNKILTDRTYEEWDILDDLSFELEKGAARLEYVDDGAMNSREEWVYIETGELQTEEVTGVNCSGFLKWVADGFYRPAPYGDGEWLTFEELLELPEEWLEKESSWDRNFEHRDPRFGLDWTRNIAAILREAFTGLETGYDQMDVDRVPFYDYKADVGYSASELETILYLLAVDRPGRIYWGAVSSPWKPAGESVTLWQYYHTALFVPRFSEEGDFICDVFQSGEWTSLEIFLHTYGEDWVHLTVSDGLKTFDPPALP